MPDRHDEATYIVEEAAPPPSAGQRMRAFISALAGTALLLGLIAGGAWYVIGLGERDAGSLPVFRAGLDPVKTRPADPGGVETPYQEIESYDVATGKGPPAETESRLAAAPARPDAEDVPQGELTSEPEPALEPDNAERQAAEEPADEAETEPAPAAPAPAAEAPRRAPAAPASRTATREEPPDPLAALGLDRGEELPSPDFAGVRAPATTPRVPDRPASSSAAETPATGQEAVDQAAQLATRAAVSRVQIQLGAFTDRAYTEAEWRRISAANRDVLSGRALSIQQTVSGGARYYRLRVGPFSDRAEAARVCETLKARGQDCLVANNS